ncbi:hypothetical protein [Mucilaginibacter galii]|nr:hypothetical protein [Mucilaginibacter galii]
MGIFEWFLLLVILLYGVKTYRRQEYPLDKWIARFVGRIKSRLRRK